ncbi:MAG: hypothetical protein KDD61_03565 [Bdellovibrionales bacterium]|nr:hypothetical protein [Bdellovibrionales bacterium]
MIKRGVISILCGIGVMVVVFHSRAAVRNSIRCDQRELSEKSCLLKKEDHTLRLKDNKVIVNNKVWRNIVTLPFQGESVFWNQVQLQSLGNRLFLSLMVWDNPVGEASIQTLYWLVYEIKSGNAHMKLKQEIQKRRFDKKTHKKLRDKAIAHQMDLNKKTGKIIWQVGKDIGEF